VECIQEELRIRQKFEIKAEKDSMNALAGGINNTGAVWGTGVGM
jgi:hypothetical protein